MTDKEAELAFLYGSGVVYQGHIYTVIGENNLKHEYTLCRLPTDERVTGVKASELTLEREHDWSKDKQRGENVGDER